jgi:hypothetical protein
MKNVDLFIEYLYDQIGEPYLWGGQHTRLTPENYKAVIAKRESKEEDRRRVEAYCEKKFSEGATVLYAYDCSGLGCYWLYNLKHLYKCDVNADTMMRRCKLTDEPPKEGYWLFKLSGSKATHIGYMVTDAELIEAGGRDVGVQKRAFRKKDWSCWGIPYVFESEIVDPDPPTDQHVLVIGKSVNVRATDSKKGKVIGIAHRGDELPYIDTAPTGWYHVRFKDKDGYITNIEKYTILEA